MSGYADEVSSERGSKQFGNSVYNYEPLLTQHIRNRSDHLRRPLAELFDVVTTMLPPMSTAGGQRYRNGHGYYDADYWHQMRTEPSLQLRFIEGYLYGLRTDPKPPVLLSRPAAWYVAEITRWFEATPQDKRAIADVLYLFRDP